MTSDVLMVENSSVATAFSSDLELLSFFEWILSIVNILGVEPPTLVCAFMASPEDKMSVMSVVLTVHIKAVTSVVSKVFASSMVPVDLLEMGSSVRSCHSVLSDLVLVSISV